MTVYRRYYKKEQLILFIHSHPQDSILELGFFKDYLDVENFASYHEKEKLKHKYYYFSEIKKVCILGMEFDGYFKLPMNAINNTFIISKVNLDELEELVLAGNLNETLDFVLSGEYTLVDSCFSEKEALELISSSDFCVSKPKRIFLKGNYLFRVVRRF